MRHFSLLATAVLVVACSGSLDEPPAGMRITVMRLRSDPYSFASSSQIGQPERLVIRDDAAWQAAWASIWRPFAPIAVPPNVDFTREMVMFVALGGRSTGGYGILVDSAMATADGVTVWVGTSSPGPRCFTTQAFTAPVDIARMPRIDASVRFVDVPTVIQC